MATTCQLCGRQPAKSMGDSMVDSDADLYAYCGECEAMLIAEAHAQDEEQDDGDGKLAAELGISVEQLAEVQAFAANATDVLGGTITSRVLYSPERLAERRVEREQEQAELTAAWMNRRRGTR